MEIFQNCPIFNDGAFDALKDRDTAVETIVPLRHGEPVRFGAVLEDGQGRLGVFRHPSGGVYVEEVTDDNVDDLVVHDAHADDPTGAFAISRLTSGGVIERAPIGIFRQVERATYDDQARQQVSMETQGVETAPRRCRT